MFTDQTYSEDGYQAAFQAAEKVAGDASVCVVRGKKRYLYDFTFELPFQVSVQGETYKGTYVMQEVSNDDHEVSLVGRVVWWCED